MAKRARFLWLRDGPVNHRRITSRNKITGQKEPNFPSKAWAMSWNPETYLAFADQRTRPAAELLARVRSEHPARVIDLGCGPGNSTALLAARWPLAQLEGLDSSAAMLAGARARDVPAQWVEADLANWTAAAPYDVIFSNATLQWLSGQETLLPRLMGFVKDGGTFAFQVPVNYDAPSHRLMREAADDSRWREKLAKVREIEHGRAETYYDILKSHAASLDIWQTEYLQVLTGEDAVYRWVSGTGLRPFLAALQGDEREAFIALYKQKLNSAYPRRADGATLFPFQRLFVVAVK
jgi:trans-aconitate 2-methyltransferase